MFMSIKEFTTDEALLSTPCEKATAEDAAVAQDLLDTLASLEGAACVHANQIGVTKSLFAYLDENDKPHVMYNPAILIGLVPKKETESCFTHEEPTVNTRYEKVKVSYQELVDGKRFPVRRISTAGWLSLSSIWPITARASWFKQPFNLASKRHWNIPMPLFL